MSCEKWVVRLGLRSNYRYIFIAMLLILSLPAYANPTPIFRASSKYYLTIVALLIEYLAIRILFKQYLSAQYALRFFLCVNLVTFPLTLLLAFLTEHMTTTSWFAEIIPLVIEPVLYIRLLKNRNIIVPHIWERVIAANLISFIVGLLLYYGNHLIYESPTFWVWYINLFGFSMRHAPYHLVVPVTYCVVIFLIVVVLHKR